MPTPAPTAESARAHALDLLARHPLVDGHNDLPWVVRQLGGLERCDIAELQPRTDTDIPRLRAGRVAMQVLAAYLPTGIANPATVTLEQIDLVLRIEERYAATFHPVRTPDDLDAARRQGRIGSFLSVEGTVGLEGSLAPLRLWHRLGVRLVTLCHNETLPWIDSATDAPDGSHTGLSEFGTVMIAEMNRLGLVIDLAHVAPHAMHRVIDVSRAPVMLTHSNAATLCPHPRNVPDDVLARIPAQGGLVMATFVPAFLNPAALAAMRPVMDRFGKAAPGSSREAYNSAKTRSIAAWNQTGIRYAADHLDYLRGKVGDDHVGIGSDFFGGVNPPGLEDASKFPDLVAELIARGWPDEAVIKVMGGNFLRVWREVLAKAGG